MALTADFGISETALRVALTRMVAAGDLVRSADGYRLADLGTRPVPGVRGCPVRHIGSSAAE